MANLSYDFCIIAVSIEKSRLFPFNATGRPTPLTNTAIGTQQ